MMRTLGYVSIHQNMCLFVHLVDDLLQSNFCAFFMVGHRALTHTLTMAVYHIAANQVCILSIQRTRSFKGLIIQAIQQKAREEVIAIMGPDGYNRHDMPTLAQISEMPYIEYVLKEVNQNTYYRSTCMFLTSLRQCVCTLQHPYCMVVQQKRISAWGTC